MSEPKNFREFLAQQKAKNKNKSKSPIEELISDLKFNPTKFLSDYKKVLQNITSKENPELKNIQDENLITLFIDTCETNPEMKKEYNNFMNLASKGFLTLNKNHETFLFELARRNNLKLFFETILNLNDLNLLNDELLLVQNNKSDNCFSNLIQELNSTNGQNSMNKKNYNELIEKVLKLIMEKYKLFDNAKPLDKFNIFNYFTKIKLADKCLTNLSKDDILKDFDIIFSSEKIFDMCKIILYDKQLPFNLLTAFLENEKFFDVVDIFIQKYTENKFCNYPELFLDFLLNILNFQNYKNIEHFLSKIINIIISEKNFEKKIGGNIYNSLFSNLKLIPKEKNLIFNTINENLFKNNNDIINQLLSQENNEGYPNFIVYLLINDFTEEDNKKFIKNILEKTTINIKKNKNILKYQNALLNLFAKDKFNNFSILFEYLEKNKLISIFKDMGNGSCYLNDIISNNISNDLVILKYVNFIINNFEQVDNFEHLKYLIKFLIKYIPYIKIEELRKIIILIKDKFITEIKKEEDEFIQKINKIGKIEYKIIDKSLFVFKSKFNEFYKSLSDLITEFWFTQGNDLTPTKDILITILDLIGVNKYNEIILSICSSNENLIYNIIDVFVEKYYSKFNLIEDKYLQYYSLFNFQNSFSDNNKLKNKNYMYFYLRFIHGLENKNTKMYYQNSIYSILNYYKYEKYFPNFFNKKDIKEINNNKELFIKTKLLQDEIKLTLLSSLLDYKNEYKKNLYFLLKQFDTSNMYSVINILNDNKNVVKINFELKFVENNDKYKLACDLLNKHLISKIYICFCDALIKKGKAFKFINFVMKEISKIIKDETEFIDIINLQLNEFIKYNDLIKQKKINIGMENEQIKNEQNIYGLDILFLLFKKMIEKTFDEKKLIIKEQYDLSKTIIDLKNSYLKEFNIISNDGEEKIFLAYGLQHDEYVSQNNQTEKKEIDYKDVISKKTNYNIEKYFLQFYNFNGNYIKNLPCENINELLKIFKTLTEKIKNTKFIEILFKDKNDLLKEIYEKMDFEGVAKIVKKDEEFSNIKEKINELKQVKEIDFKSFFESLVKFYEILV